MCNASELWLAHTVRLGLMEAMLQEEPKDATGDDEKSAKGQGTQRESKGRDNRGAHGARAEGAAPTPKHPTARRQLQSPSGAAEAPVVASHAPLELAVRRGARRRRSGRLLPRRHGGLHPPERVRVYRLRRGKVPEVR